MSSVALRIQWDLATPWSPPPHGIHLDGLIARIIVEEHTREGTPFTYDGVHADLPFARHETPLGTVYKASLLQPEGIRGAERRYMTEKTSMQDLAERSADGELEGRPMKTIDTVRGPFKNGALWYTEQTIDALVAWCITDEPDRLIPLLGAITHIGKRVRFDLGRVAKLQVDEDPEALDKWRLRQMPEPVEGYVEILGRLGPPYWQAEGATTVWRPL